MQEVSAENIPAAVEIFYKKLAKNAEFRIIKLCSLPKFSLEGLG